MIKKILGTLMLFLPSALWSQDAAQSYGPVKQYFFLLSILVLTALAIFALLKKFKLSKNWITIVWIWLGWMAVLSGFQVYMDGRMAPERPDFANSDWTQYETHVRELPGRPYLNEPFLNQHVAWDSEYYISIGVTGGYEDSNVPSIPGMGIPLNYAFFPLYPLLSGLFSLPGRLLGMNPVHAVTLSAVWLSALGSLLAALSLYEILKKRLDKKAAKRGIWYFLIFPSAFFLGQVYTEGLFCGLAFLTLALCDKKKYLPAMVAASLAVLTRAVGLALVGALGVAWLVDLFSQREKGKLLPAFSWKRYSPALWAIVPLIIYLIWSFSRWGQTFKLVEDNYFGRHLFAFKQSFQAWGYAWYKLFTPGYTGAEKAYYAMEFAAILFTPIALIFTAKKYPAITVYGLLVYAVSLFSGGAQGMHRYILPIPSVYLVLARWGKNPAFDRTFTLGSTALFALGAGLFSFNFWVG